MCGNVKQAIREYRRAYVEHQANVRAYAGKRVEWSVVARSAAALKLAQATVTVELEAREVIR